MSDYIDIPVETDPDALAEDAYAYLQSKAPEWQPNDGNLETWIIEALALLASIVRDTASAVPTAIFRYFGNSVALLAPQEGAKATTTTTWTMIDNAGYTIPAGTQVGIRTAGDTLVPFLVLNEVVVLPGSTVTATGEVTIQAVDVGNAASGLGAPAAEVELIDPLIYVLTITMVAGTIGGTDAETDAQYLDRLRYMLQLMTPRPILPKDFALLYREHPSIERAVAVDGYNPKHNLLTVNQASLETDTTGWAVDVNSTIARDLAQAAHGVASLRIDAVAAGNASAQTTPITQYVAAPGEQFTARADFRAATVGRSVRLGLRWYTSGSVLISETLGSTVADVTGSFTAASVTGIAPTTAAFVRVVAYALATGSAGEDHYVDRIVLRKGANTEWEVGNTPASGNERMITLAGVDAEGEAASSTVKTEVATDLGARREVNFIVHIIDPSYLTIDVTYTVRALLGFEIADVEARTEAAISDYLSPANWGRPRTGIPALYSASAWLTNTVIRYLELISALDGVEGVDYVVSLTFGIGGQTQGVLDLALPGPASLTRAGIIAGTVQAGV